MECKHCGHKLHPGNLGKCPIKDCECINSEPNALDELLRSLGRENKKD